MKKIIVALMCVWGLPLLACEGCLKKNIGQTVTGNGIVATFKAKLGDFGFLDGQFNTPSRLGITGDSLWVVDSLNKRIQRIRSNGVFEFSFKTILNEDGEASVMDTPVGIAINPRGSVYVTDMGESTLNVFDTLGKFQKTLGKFGNSGLSFNQPQAVSVDSQGNLFIADTNNHRIVQLDETGKKILTIPSSEGQLKYPIDVAVLPNGDIWVLDEVGLKQYSPSGRFLKVLRTFNAATALDIDSQQRFFVANPSSGNIIVLNTKNETLLTLTEPLKKPLDVLIANKHLYITDIGYHAVLIYQLK